MVNPPQFSLEGRLSGWRFSWDGGLCWKSYLSVLVSTACLRLLYTAKQKLYFTKVIMSENHALIFGKWNPNIIGVVSNTSLRCKWYYGLGYHKRAGRRISRWKHIFTNHGPYQSTPDCWSCAMALFEETWSCEWAGLAHRKGPRRFGSRNEGEGQRNWDRDTCIFLR